MPEPQILHRMCDNSVNKAVHGLAAIFVSASCRATSKK